RGYDVHVDDQRTTAPPLHVATDFVDACDAGERALVDSLARERLGQIEVGGWEDAVDKCVLVARAFPQARVVAAVATRRQARRLWRVLERQLGERVGLALAGVRRRGRSDTVSRGRDA